MNLIKLLLLCLLFIECSAKINLGLVKKGAFLLSFEPNKLKNNDLVHSLIGYLPAGTRVKISEKRFIRNMKTTQIESYYSVVSEFGTRGLVREDLLVKSNGKILAISVASYPIIIHQKYATLLNEKKLLTLGSRSGNYLEITGEKTKGFYDAILHRNIIKNSLLPKEEKVRLKKFYVQKNKVSILDPSDSSLVKMFNKEWNVISVSDETFIKTVTKKIKSKLKITDSKLYNYLLSVNDFECMLKGSGNAKLGFEIFSIGLGLNFSLNIKESDVKYIFKSNSLIDGFDKKLYTAIGVVECKDAVPFRMKKFIVQESNGDFKNKFLVKLEDLKKSNSPWIITFQTEEITNKMVRIRGWEEYNQLLKVLNRLAQLGGGYLSGLSEESRMLILNYIITNIGFFEHNEILTKR